MHNAYVSQVYRSRSYVQIGLAHIMEPLFILFIHVAYRAETCQLPVDPLIDHINQKTISGVAEQRSKMLNRKLNVRLTSVVTASNGAQKTVLKKRHPTAFKGYLIHRYFYYNLICTSFFSKVLVIPVSTKIALIEVLRRLSLTR